MKTLSCGGTGQSRWRLMLGLKNSDIAGPALRRARGRRTRVETLGRTCHYDAQIRRRIVSSGLKQKPRCGEPPRAFVMGLQSFPWDCPITNPCA